MGWLKGMRARLRSGFRRGAMEAEMEEEFRFHLEMETERLIGDGMTPLEARRQALLAFGGVTRHQEALRDGRAIPLLESLWRDVRVSVRGLRRSPALVIGAVVSLGLAIGLNTAMFSFANVLLFKPLPGPMGERLVHVWVTKSGERVGVSRPDFLEYRDRSRTLEGLAAYTLRQPVVRWRSGAARSRDVQLVSANFFEVLGAKPERGRFFRPEEDRTPGTDPVVVVGHHFWQTELAGEAGVVGDTLMLDRQPFIIVGVAPEWFVGAMPPEAIDFFVPTMMAGVLSGGQPLDPTRGGSSVGSLIGRMRPGGTPAGVAAELSGLAAGLARAYPETNAGRDRVEVLPVQGTIPQIKETMIPGLLFVMAMVGLVLLVACSNVAGLLLARAAARKHEIAIRLSLGAGRLVLVRQLLVESLLLAIPGGLLGFILSLRGARALEALMGLPIGSRIEMDVSPDARVLAFTAAISLGSAVLFGLVPAVQATRRDLASALRRDVSAGRERRRLGSGVVVAQVAFTVVLVLAASVFVRKVLESTWVDPGIGAENVVAAYVALGGQGADPARAGAVVADLAHRLEARPEVSGVGMGTATVMGCCAREAPVRLAGEEPAESGAERSIPFNAVSAGLLEMLDIPLLRGRTFDARDSEGSPRVAIVTQSTARRLWPGLDPLGQRLRLGRPFDDREYEVVGVVADARYVADGGKDSPYLFLAFAQNRKEAGRPRIYLRARYGDPHALIGLVEREARALDPDAPATAVTLRDEMRDALHSRRVFGTLFGVCALITLLLAALGTYALLRYTVVRRTREIGIRLALGAREAQVHWTVVRQGVTIVASGTLVGLPLGYLGARGLGRMFGGADPAEPLTFAAVTVLLLAVAALASWLPARRATRVDPMVALRVE